MKVQISESQPGEFRETRAVLEDRAVAGIQAALETALDLENHSPLEKAQAASRRGGEVDAIEELTKHMVSLYEKRSKQILADLTKVLESSVEGR